MSWVSYFPPKAFNFYTFRLSFFCFWIVGNGKQWGGSSSKMVRFLNNNSGFFEAANCQAKGGWNKMNHFLSGFRMPPTDSTLQQLTFWGVFCVAVPE